MKVGEENQRQVLLDGFRTKADHSIQKHWEKTREKSL